MCTVAIALSNVVVHLVVCAYCVELSPFTALVCPLQSSLSFPSDVDVNSDARDLVSKLLQDSKDRIDFEGVRTHPFFALVRWDHLLDST